MSDSYSTDRHGRVSTPRIDVSSDRKQAQDLAQSGPGRPRKTGKQPAVPYQTSLERKKREVGPGIDRGGATLANPRRRLGFLEDADFEEVVE